MLRHSLLVRSAVALTIFGFTPMPAPAAAQVSTPASQAVSPAFVAAAGMQNATRTRNRSAPAQRGASAPRTGPEVVAEAQDLLARTETHCQISDAVSPGQNSDGNNLYEVACEGAPTGYILSAGDQPWAYNCLVMSIQADAQRAANRTASPLVCELPGNANPQQLMDGYIASARISCQVDERRWLGRSSETGANIYEVGCAGEDGYWLRADRNGAFETRIECLEVVTTGGQCQFTTPAEQSATFQQLGAAAPATCTTEDGRWIGNTTSARFYEIKCSEGVGYIAETSPLRAPQAFTDCIRPHPSVREGCTLTDVSQAQARIASERAEILASLGRVCTIEDHQNLGTLAATDELPSREIIEFQCNEQPWGLVGYFDVAGGPAGAEIRDCLSIDGLGLECQLTSRWGIIAELNRLFTESVNTRNHRNCEVSNYRVIGWDADTNDDVMEIACATERVWFGPIPHNRSGLGDLIRCEVAARNNIHTCQLQPGASPEDQ